MSKDRRKSVAGLSICLQMIVAFLSDDCRISDQGLRRGNGLLVSSKRTCRLWQLCSSSSLRNRPQAVFNGGQGDIGFECFVPVKR